MGVLVNRHDLQVFWVAVPVLEVVESVLEVVVAVIEVVVCEILMWRNAGPENYVN